MLTHWFLLCFKIQISTVKGLNYANYIKTEETERMPTKLIFHLFTYQRGKWNILYSKFHKLPNKDWDISKCILLANTVSGTLIFKVSLIWLIIQTRYVFSEDILIFRLLVLSLMKLSMLFEDAIMTSFGFVRSWLRLSQLISFQWVIYSPLSLCMNVSVSLQVNRLLCMCL